MAKQRSAVPPVKLAETAAAPRARTKMTERDEAEIVETMRRHDVTTSKSHDALTSRRGMVERSGRRLKDGTRAGAGPARKLTLYVKPENGMKLELLAVRRGVSLSDLVDGMLDELPDNPK